MSAYQFETISSAQAAAYAGATDSLTFQTPGNAMQVGVAFQPGGDTVSVAFGGQTVMFGSGIFGDQDLRFADGGMLFIGTSGADSASGGALGDALFGGPAADTLLGAGGADFLQGNQGDDSLSGGAGDDFVYGGQGNDAINVGSGFNFGHGNLGDDTITADADSRNTLLGGQGNDVIVGGAGDDFLNGNLGNDSISGGGGADTIAGEGGSDTMDGGAGPDRFLIAAGSSDSSQAGADRILNWSSEDTIDVPGAGGPAAYYLIPANLISGGSTGGVDPYGYDTPPPSDAAPVYSTIPYATALSTANSWIRGHPTNTVVTAQVDEGVAVFIDSDGDRAADLAIILVGKTIADVSGANFV